MGWASEPLDTAYTPGIIPTSKVHSASQVKYMSTEYSGRTEITATTAKAKACETSAWAASHAHSNKNAALEMARPATTTITGAGKATCARRAKNARRRRAGSRQQS